MGLVVADGVLTKFAANTSRVEPVTDAPRGIDAMAIPPDGRRLAFIIREKLYVAPLVRDSAGVTVGPAQEVPTALVDLDGVAWSQQSRLMVAGRLKGGRTAFFEVTVDGAMQVNKEVEGLGGAEVTHLVAFADDPRDGPFAGQVMYVVADSQAYDLFSKPRQLTASNLAATSTTPPTARDSRIAAPFFVD